MLSLSNGKSAHNKSRKGIIHQAVILSLSISIFIFPLRLEIPTFDRSCPFPKSSTESPPVTGPSLVSVAEPSSLSMEGPSVSSATAPMEDFRYLYKIYH